MAQHILLIEDDRDIATLITYQLRQAKYQIEVEHDGERGLKAALRNVPSMVILDLMLPSLDGLSICKALRSNSKTQNVPILMVTAKGEEIDRIAGFELGADDYLSKPFSPRELVLRVQAIFKRMKTTETAIKAGKMQPIQEGDLLIDPIRHQVIYKDSPVTLTMLEFRLLYFLMNSKGKVATRDTLLDKIWGYDLAYTTRTVDTHVKRLRQKLGKAGGALETVRGLGYRWSDAT